MTRHIDVIAYIEWGGQYDRRELELIEYPPGEFSYEDMTGGHMTLHNHLSVHTSAESAKTELVDFVRQLGEPHSYVDFGGVR